MSDFSVTGKRGKTIQFLVTATKTLPNGSEEPIDLTIPGTILKATGRVTDADALLFTRDYYASGGAPNGGITVPAPNQLATNVAEITIPANDPGILTLTKTSYVRVDVELTESDGTVTDLATGVVKVRYWSTGSSGTGNNLPDTVYATLAELDTETSEREAADAAEAAARAAGDTTAVGVAAGLALILGG